MINKAQEGSYGKAPNKQDLTLLSPLPTVSLAGCMKCFLSAGHESEFRVYCFVYFQDPPKEVDSSFLSVLVLF